MPTIREVKTELRHREWAEQIQECRKRQPNPAPPKSKMSRDKPRLKSRIRFITMNCSELL